MFLASTSDIIRIVTGSAVSTIGAQADWVDNASGSYTPGRTNTAITTATTTTVVASPGASTVRNVRGLNISNNHATSPCLVTVQHYDGTTSIDIIKVTLKAGESLIMAEDGEWRHLTAYGADYEAAGLVIPNLGITGTLAETLPRNLIPETAIGPLSSGQLFLIGIYLKKDTVVTNISFFSAGTAANTPTNQIFALYGQGWQLLAQTSNDTTTAWAANTIKTLALTAPYTISRDGWYYVGIMVTATTVPTLKGIQRIAIQLLDRQPDGAFNGTSGLTTTLPELSSTNTATSNMPWAAVT